MLVTLVSQTWRRGVATSKGAELSYDLDQVISFWLWILSAFVEISTFRGNYSHFLDISIFVDIIRIGHIMSYLAQNFSHGLQIFILVMDIIYISHTTIYLARNDCPIFYIYSSSESDWCIPSFPVCNLIYFSVPSSFYLVSLVSEYKLSPNHIQIYVHTFITSIEASFYFSHDFPICALYLCVV